MEPRADLLRQLADGGFAAVAGEQLAELAREARQQCERDLDERYCIIASTLEAIDAWWVENEHGGVPNQVLRLIERQLERLNEVIDAPGAHSGALVARDVRDAIEDAMTGPDEWEAQGWVIRGYRPPENSG